MKSTFNINDEAQSTRWNNFVAASPHGDVLQTLEWGEVKKPDWQPVPVSAEENGELMATALVLKRKLPGGKCLFSVPRGPILDWSNPRLFGLIKEQLLIAAHLHGAIYIKIDPALPDKSTFSDLFTRNGFIRSPEARASFGGTQPRCVMKLDISPPLEEVMANFHTKWRYNIRLGARKGLIVKSDCTRDDLKIFHPIYQETAERDGFTGYSLSYFQTQWDILVKRGMAKLFLVYHEDQPLSGAISFVLGKQCWYVFGASSNEKCNLMPNHSMQWAMMNWAKECGCDTYDFRGVHDMPDGTTAADLMESDDGLVRFKAGFGAELIRYTGEWDLPLSKPWYWAWTSLRPALQKWRK